MAPWPKLFNGSTDGAREELSSLLPTQERVIPPAIPAETVTKIALRLKHQIETVIPCEVEEDSVIKALSPVITPKVVETATKAGGEEHKSCVVYSLLVCQRWFRRQAMLELWDADLHNVRATACEIVAKRIIESEEDMDYLLEQVLLRRFAILIDGEDSMASNVIEIAVDIHALNVIGSSGYQKCINYLWRGWLVQDDDHAARFVQYEQKINTSFWAHLDPDRMRVPQYQNALQVTFSIVFLGLYTGAINSINPTGDVDVVEALLYIFTVGFIADEVSKFAKVGRYYLSFWNVFNSVLYALLTISFITRMIALGHELGSGQRRDFNVLSYNFLAFTAPMFWIRLMLYLDTFRFFGAMLVVVKIMMKESLIFFALLVFVLVGFFQAFIGLDQVDEDLGKTSFVVTAMANAIMSSPDFGGFDNFSPPFGILLYYLFTFVVMVVLLNILIALYNSAYEETTSNATDEYMALFALKCLQFVRAPDDNVFIPPFNLIELFCLIIPFEWWLSKATYAWLNDVVMAVIYAPLLTMTAALETSDARKIKVNRKRGEADDDTVEEWEQLGWDVEQEDKGWCEMVGKSSPDVMSDPVASDVTALKREVQELRAMLGKVLERVG
ncbi:MAG: hypothetical protein M1828_001067 [Chrysothrix sp. TS-e1954]|nr:MAG: hypothetical protein M1828_001067 [Chrysothrix sp. TS-e1954]